MKTIQLTKGYVTLVDDEDFEKAIQFNWVANEIPRKDGLVTRVYAQRSVQREDGVWVIQRLHRFIMNVTDSKIDVDHRNHDGLDNRRDNLRIATQTQNNCNSRKRIGTSSQWKGVGWDKERGKWLVKIKVNSKTKNLGRFTSEVTAAFAYDSAARQYFGEFAHCNFPSLPVAA